LLESVREELNFYTENVKKMMILTIFTKKVTIAVGSCRALLPPKIDRFVFLVAPLRFKCQFLPIGGKEPQHSCPVIGDISREYPLPLFVNDREVTILCMEIDSTVQCHEAPPD
jgi:hypothetical protein